MRLLGVLGVPSICFAATIDVPDDFGGDPPDYDGLEAGRSELEEVMQDARKDVAALESRRHASSFLDKGRADPEHAPSSESVGSVSEGTAAPYDGAPGDEAKLMAAFDDPAVMAEERKLEKAEGLLKEDAVESQEEGDAAAKEAADQAQAQLEGFERRARELAKDEQKEAVRLSATKKLWNNPRRSSLLDVGSVLESRETPAELSAELKEFGEGADRAYEHMENRLSDALGVDAKAAAANALAGRHQVLAPSALDRFRSA